MDSDKKTSSYGENDETDLPEDDVFDDGGDFADIDVDEAGLDITGNPDIDFAAEAGETAGGASGKGKGGAARKMLAPVLVLAAAAGVGGFIVMNPQILGGGSASAPAGASPMEYVSHPSGADAPQQVAQDITENAPQETADAGMFSDVPPQPAAGQNEMPRAPEPMDGFGADQEMPTAAQESEMAQGDASGDETDAVADSGPGGGEDLARELYNLKFPGEDAEEQQAAQEMPPPELPAAPEPEMAAAAAPEPVMEPAPEVMPEPAPEPEPEIVLAQAEVAGGAEAEPPAMPDIFTAPEAGEPAQERDVTPPPAAAPKKAALAPETLMDNATGTAAEPVKPSNAAPAANAYYDGRVPTGPLATETGPRKVDPVMEPASQLVVVKKSYEAGDMESAVVAANRALQLKRYDSALEMFDDLYARNARDPRVLMGRAVAQQNMGLDEAAIKTYEELLAINPKNADALVNMLGLIRHQYPEVALRRLLDLYAKYPNNAGVAAQIGVTQADLSHYEESMRYLGIAASLEPKNPQHMFNMAIIADRRGDSAAAIKYYEQALELDAVYQGGRSIPRDSVYDRLSTLRRR